MAGTIHPHQVCARGCVVLCVLVVHDDTHTHRERPDPAAAAATAAVYFQLGWGIKQGGGGTYVSGGRWPN